MPTDYELYYGFTRFAIELNELCPELKDVLPRTDARFRPDQRYSITSPPTNTQPLPPSNEKTVVNRIVTSVNLQLVLFLSE